MLANLLRWPKEADLAAYAQKLQQAAVDSYLTPEEEAELNALKEELGLTEEDLAPTRPQLERLRRFTALKDGRLPVLQADILLKKGEICHLEVPCELMEEVTRTRYTGKSQGVSFRIAKGVYYRVGGFQGNPVRETHREVTDRGTLYITNKRIIFLGAKKNVTYPLGSIVNFVKYKDAVQF